MDTNYFLKTATANINHVNNNIKKQTNIIKDNLDKLNYDWDEVLGHLPEKDKIEIKNTILDALDAIELAVKEMTD